MKKKPLGIYLHIPFCVRKCNYCDFLSGPADRAVRRAYVSRLKQEISEFENAGEYQVQSIFFGGGTPSVLEGEEIAELMEELGRMQLDAAAEITIECNPGTLTGDKLENYRQCGINRLSIGLQSADAKELRLLGRIHTWEMFLDNYENARRAGFTNINIDLMSALPGQTVESWQSTLEKVLALKPEHISAYSLIIEEGTPFYERYGAEAAMREKGQAGHELPSEEAEREMYYDTKRLLEAAGLGRYEISNYARPGYESRHNSGYWTRRDYAGFGLGASSLLHNLRYKNTDVLADYLEGDFSKREVLVLSKDNQIEETMYLGLRMMQGISKQKFLEDFQVPVDVVYRSQLELLQRKGLLRETGNRIRLTELGIDVSNRVLAEFLLTD
ncbi:MAG: radical SAM family heme chaperone HemW [Lachnospiraceae bacterium]|nr:radical SAM family heme chaperone HemW [Lachnospiraceae bacterium]